jgi:hypothetical protein
MRNPNQGHLVAIVAPLILYKFAFYINENFQTVDELWAIQSSPFEVIPYLIWDQRRETSSRSDVSGCFERYTCLFQQCRSYILNGHKIYFQRLEQDSRQHAKSYAACLKKIYSMELTSFFPSRRL